jgi:uncharacterized repeat protein (TIGR04076 family)
MLMKKLYQEDYRFTITVIDGCRDDNGVINCRNGHEIGDTYICEYGCPEGFCSKTMMKLFPLMEVVRSGGDLRKLRRAADQSSCEFSCTDGDVQFRLESERIN